jgi:septum formation protein
MTVATDAAATGSIRLTSQVVLASASAARFGLLQAAGVPVTVDAAAVDEAEVRESLQAAGASPAGMAEALAELKAQQVSRRRPGVLVIGADQILECNGTVFDKPTNLIEARRQLLTLRGRRHRLQSAVVLVRDGQRLWHHVDRASLAMREFSESFLDAYLQSAGSGALSSVGGYQLEGPGVQLFSDIDGDYFTILGLPLLPLLDVLREHGVLTA